MAISSSMRARPRRGGSTGSPAAARTSRTRVASAAAIRPVRAESSAASPSPAATAVQQPAVAAPRLDRVPESVPEVEERAPALLALVLDDDRRLDRTRAADRFLERGGVALEELREVRLEPVEELRIGDERGLHDLGKAGAQLAIRQRRKRVRVRDDGGRLVEG